MKAWATKVSDLPRQCVCGADMMADFGETNGFPNFNWRYWRCEDWWSWVRHTEHLFLIQRPDLVVWRRWTDGGWT